VSYFRWMIVVVGCLRSSALCALNVERRNSLEQAILFSFFLHYGKWIAKIQNQSRKGEKKWVTHCGSISVVRHRR